MKTARPPSRRPAAALISAVAILLVVAVFAAVFLSVHSTQVSTAELAVCRLRAEAAALAATQLTLWKLNQDSGQQADIARVVYEHDTSFQAAPLFQIDGDLAGATFHVDLWPGENRVRLKTVAQCGGVYFQRWAQAPIRLETATNLVKGGDFEDPATIMRLPIWRGAYSLGQWLAGYGLTLVDDPRRWPALFPWNITRDGNNHFAEELRSSRSAARIRCRRWPCFIRACPATTAGRTRASCSTTAATCRIPPTGPTSRPMSTPVRVTRTTSCKSWPSAAGAARRPHRNGRSITSACAAAVSAGARPEKCAVGGGTSAVAKRAWPINTSFASGR